MKNLRNKFWGLVILMVLTTFGSYAQSLVVRVRPPRPKVVVTRPPRPSVAHVWVDEDWRPAGRTYEYHGGYWAAPPRPHARWVPGHWAHHSRTGWVWKPGYWH